MSEHKPKTVVKMFKPRFAPMVKDGTKRQTVRPIPKRERDMPRVGDRFSGREWTGKAYASKQRVLREGIVTGVQEVALHCLGVEFSALNGLLDDDALEKFALADGFDSYPEMEAWFAENHGLPFTGILIQWQPA